MKTDTGFIEAQKKFKDDLNETIDYYAEKCLADFNDEKIAAIQANQNDLLYRHMVLGLYIRNTYIYGQNIEFVPYPYNADDFSGLIVDKIVEKINTKGN